MRSPVDESLRPGFEGLDGLLGEKDRVTGGLGEVAPKYGYGPGVKGNNNITTIVGNLSKAGSKGNGNLTSVLGHRSIARSFGDNKVSAAIGDDKKNVNGTDVS